MLPLVVIRPQPGASATCARAAALGLHAIAAPLFDIRPLSWEPVPVGRIDALLLGSTNALRHGGPAVALYRGMPAYAVGASTAEAARDAGLHVAATGAGGLQSVMALLRPEHARLLRLAGRERVDLHPPQGVSMIERVTYASERLPLPDSLATALAAPALVLLHSGEAAAHFARACDAAGLSRDRIALAALGPRIAAAAGDGWRALETAPSADDSALLALAAQMCQRLQQG